MLTETDLQMLSIAYEEAKLGFDEGGCPIGSVLARGGEEVSRGHNQRVQQGDPIAHGEMDALRKAGRQKTYRDTSSPPRASTEPMGHPPSSKPNFASS